MNKIDKAKKYAVAFSESKEKERELLLLKQLKEFNMLLEENKELLIILNSNYLGKKEKKKILSDILNVKYDNDLLLLLFVLIDNNKLCLLKDIYFLMEDIIYRKNNIINIKIFSVLKLSDEQIEKIKKIYIKKYLASSAVVNTQLEEKLIGGIKIIINGIVEDDSIMSKLKQVKRNLEIDI